MPWGLPRPYRILKIYKHFPQQHKLCLLNIHYPQDGNIKNVLLDGRFTVPRPFLRPVETGAIMILPLDLQLGTPLNNNKTGLLLFGVKVIQMAYSSGMVEQIFAIIRNPAIKLYLFRAFFQEYYNNSALRQNQTNYRHPSPT
jgi:hypothetical protein